ncbi:type II toxin-antitoxin system YafQ family toxin [Rothia nasimurium]|uniref:type II toxin-antitoxin system RelE/ParE family toxin n=1 Tax=Rothia nasimurium TaxID=85336 RepID=UPI003C6E1054
MLLPEYTPAFARDIKKLQKKRVNLEHLKPVTELILDNSPDSMEELRRRHRMHTLKGNWAGAKECHVANAGDWLLIWRTSKTHAYFLRTGTHDDLF